MILTITGILTGHDYHQNREELIIVEHVGDFKRLLDDLIWSYFESFRSAISMKNVRNKNHF
jgi:hypothetical protein